MNLLVLPAMEKQPYIGVCLGPRCGDYGGRALMQALRDSEAVNCRSLCAHAPVVALEGRCLLRATAQEVVEEMRR